MRDTRRELLPPMLRCFCVCARLCILDTTLSPTKAAEPIEFSFGMRTRVGSRNHVLGGARRIPHGNKHFWRIFLSCPVGDRHSQHIQRYSQTDSCDAVSGYQYCSNLFQLGLAACLPSAAVA